MRTKLAILFVIVLLALTASSVAASIGHVIWQMKCPPWASVIVTEYPDGTNLVKCFMYIEEKK